MSTQFQSSHVFHGMSLHISVTIAPENVDKFLAAAKPVFDAIVAEPECTFFELFHDPQIPGHFKWVENWTKDEDWFMKHQMPKDYYKPYLEATEPMFIKPREVQFFHRMPAGWTNVKAGQMNEG